MSPAVQQMVSWGAVALISAAALTVILVGWLGYGLLRRFVNSFGTLVEVAAIQQVLTEKSAKALTQTILDAVKTSSPATASLVLKSLVEMGMKRLGDPLAEDSVPHPPMPIPPVPPAAAEEKPAAASGKPFNPFKDSTRAITAIAVSLFVVGAMTADHEPRACAMDGLAALRRGNVEAAEAKFRHEGNDLRTAECLILQGKLDAASVLCEPIDSPASLRLRAIIARKRGDDAAAGALWQQAAERGDEVAKSVIAMGGATHD